MKPARGEAPPDGGPLYILVTGLPGSGKTTLGRQLAATLGLPLLSRDAVKERLFDVMGVRDRGWSLTLGAAANEVLWAIAADCPRGAVIDVWLDPSRGDDDRARAGLRASGIAVTHEVRCDCPAETAVARYSRRDARHPGHLPADAETLERIRRLGPLLRPLGIGTLLPVDTSGPVDVARLAELITARSEAVLGAGDVTEPAAPSASRQQASRPLPSRSGKV